MQRGIGYFVNRDRCVLKDGIYFGEGNRDLRAGGHVARAPAPLPYSSRRAPVRIPYGSRTATARLPYGSRTASIRCLHTQPWGELANPSVGLRVLGLRVWGLVQP